VRCGDPLLFSKLTGLRATENGSLHTPFLIHRR
jgi:hypothetical protein